MGVEELSDAIRAAERYPSLAAEVEAARGLRERWRKRAEAQVGVPFGCPAMRQLWDLVCSALGWVGKWWRTRAHAQVCGWKLRQPESNMHMGPSSLTCRSVFA